MIANTIGIDLGIQCFAFLSDGRKIEPPKYLLQAEKKLQKEQRRLSRRQKGTGNWEKQVEKVQKIHTKVANQRRDFLHKQSYRIAEAYTVAVVEDLNIRNMVKNRRIAKQIYDAGWGMFRDMLVYKLEHRGRTFIKVKPHYTSVECSDLR
ncbi:RNA-guided endonuclease InsQ/TnpB family protein [Radiobacillus sp. PE A8.2]|uniref:RNA-guided endonuclease InsQ/TnpB family protein n=1 Tax=Radiobacillus sp. PE A8.2 TaxID=3380349 RepID=UPI00388E07EF